MNHLRRSVSLRPSRLKGECILAAAVVAASVLFGSIPTAAGPPSDSPSHRRHTHKEVSRGSVGETGPRSKPLRQAAGVPSQPAAEVPASEVDPIEMKVLVLAGDGTEVDLPAITQALDYLGTPYTVAKAAPVPADASSNRFTTPGSALPALVEGPLESSIHAYYQSVILTTGELGFVASDGAYRSALTPAEWSYLWAFEARFKIRQVSWYTYPNSTYGFNPPEAEGDTTDAPITAPFTAAGQSVFSSYLNTATPVTIANAYAYRATPLDSDTVPLLSDSQGNALAAIRTYPDGREALALTFDSNQHLLHNLVLSYGLVNWATRGFFLGERHVYLSAQVDDLLIDGSIWAVGTPCDTAPDDPTLPVYRTTGADLQAAVKWQARVQQQPVTRDFKLQMAFNGVGSTAEYYQYYRSRNAGAPRVDKLVSQVRSNRSRFPWINHTYNHKNLDSLDYATAKYELESNGAVAGSLGFTSYSKKNFVQPDVSGLANPEFLGAAFDFGTRYLVSDTSRGGFNENPSPNAGYYNTIRPSMLQIPRRPNNLYFNVSTPQEWLAEDNCLYPAGAHGHVGTYEELLDRESNVLLTYLLKGDIDPWMFHQNNLRAYDGTRSLLGDLLDATLTKYRKYFTLPVLSPTMDVLGGLVASRMQYNQAGVTAQFVPGPNGPESIKLTSQKPATVPVTGLGVAGAEFYGGQYIAHVPVGAGEEVNLAPQAVVSPASVSLPKQQVNTTSTAVPVKLSNPGTAQLSITGISTTAGFSQTNNCGSQLAPGANCTISVSFGPGTAGSHNGSLTVTHNASGGPTSVPLSGTGMSLSVTPTSLNFGSQLLLTESAAKTVTVTNGGPAGSAPVAISGVSISGPSDFSQTNNCPTSLAAGATCRIDVTFRPTGLFSRTATLTINHDVNGAPRNVALSGSGL